MEHNNYCEHMHDRVKNSGVFPQSMHKFINRQFQNHNRDMPSGNKIFHKFLLQLNPLTYDLSSMIVCIRTYQCAWLGYKYCIYITNGLVHHGIEFPLCFRSVQEVFHRFVWLLSHKKLP